MLEPMEIRFPRSTKPASAVGQPRLVGFCDAADHAMCAVLYVVWSLGHGKSTSTLLMGKCWITPLTGSTIPRGELQSLVILHRFAVVAVEGFPARFASISMYTDSMSSVGAMEKTGGVLRPFFANRVSELKRIRSSLSEVSDEVPRIHHIPGNLNPADIGTRGQATLKDLGLESRWQCGPNFLRQPYMEWPTTCSSIREKMEMPAQEVRSSKNVFMVSQPPPRNDSLTTVLSSGIERGTVLGNCMELAVGCILQREKLELSTRALARMLNAVLGNDRNLCKVSPSQRLIELAVFVLLRCASASA